MTSIQKQRQAHRGIRDSPDENEIHREVEVKESGQQQNGCQGGRPILSEYRFLLVGHHLTLHTMRPILLQHHWRTALPRSVQRDLRHRVWVRFKSQVPRPSQRHEPAPLESKEPSSTPTRSTPTTPSISPKTSIRRGIGITYTPRNCLHTERKL